MKKLNILVLVSAISLLVGCGGGSGSTSNTVPAGVDNSKNTNTENQYGYFGYNVIFGKYVAAQSWTLLQDGTTDTMILTLSTDGDLRLQNGSQYLTGDYGVSKDGKTIKSSILNNISITGVRKDYKQQIGANGQSEYVDCYDVSGGNSNIIMCP